MFNHARIATQIIKRQLILKVGGISPVLARLLVDRTALMRRHRRGKINQVDLESIWPNKVGPVLRDQPLNHVGDYDITVVLPAYNVEKYIANALTSVLTQQTTAKVEVLIVEDQSTDATLSIIDQTLQNVPTNHVVRVIKKQNEGISAARNTAIEQARGRYVFCIDADDYIDANTLDALYQQAEADDLEMVQCRTESFFRGRVIEMHSSQTGMSGYPWSKLMKLSVWDDVQFPKNALFEDSIFKYLILPRVKRIGFNDSVNYHYRINPKGLNVQSKVNLHVLDTVYVMEKMAIAQAKLGITRDVAQLHDYLDQIRLNARRVELMSHETQLAVYQHARKFLAEFQANNEENKLETTHQNGRLQASLVADEFDNYIRQSIWRL